MHRKNLAVAAGVAASLLLAGAVAVILPVSGYIGESYGVLRSAERIAVPEPRPYTEGVVAPGYREAADRARVLLVAHAADIGVPAFSAAVAMDGEMVWSGAVGYSDVAAQRPATPETLFRLGSTSKAVTATLFARMVDAGLVDPDAPISTYINELPNADWADLTPRQLASHTAGIVGYEENRDLTGLIGSLRLQRHYEDQADTLELFDDTGLLFAPGTDFHYSSFDTQLLAVALQAAGGAPFERLVERWVTAPLGIETPIADYERPDRAEFYHAEDGVAQLWRQVDLSSKLAGGGFMARPEDMTRLGAAWLDADFISPRTREAFWTAQVLADETMNPQCYALGWRRSENMAGRESPLLNMNHGGVSKGAMSWLAVVPERNMAVSMTIISLVWPFFEWAGVYADLVEIFEAPAGDADISGRAAPAPAQERP